MYAKLEEEIIVAATAAKVAGFDRTYESLLKLLETIRAKNGDLSSSNKIVILADTNSLN